MQQRNVKDNVTTAAEIDKRLDLDFFSECKTAYNIAPKVEKGRWLYWTD